MPTAVGPSRPANSPSAPAPLRKARPGSQVSGTPTWALLARTNFARARSAAAMAALASAVTETTVTTRTSCTGASPHLGGEPVHGRSGLRDRGDAHGMSRRRRVRSRRLDVVDAPPLRATDDAGAVETREDGEAGEAGAVPDGGLGALDDQFGEFPLPCRVDFEDVDEHDGLIGHGLWCSFVPSAGAACARTGSDESPLRNVRSAGPRRPGSRSGGPRRHTVVVMQRTEAQEEVAPMRDRRLLTNMAYRLLGSVSEAEDAVQEAYVRWYSIPEDRRGEVRSPTAWLVTALSRICMDVLGSARRRRVRYIGEWLPEPVSPSAMWTSLSGDRDTGDPAELVALEESLDVALLVVLE